MRLWARLFHRNINKGRFVLIAMICIVALTLIACAASGDCDSANTNSEIGSSVVGVETGSICDLDLSERGYNLRRYETIADLYNVLQEDLVDYVAIEEDTGECFLERDSSFVSLGETDAVEHLGIIIGNVDNQAQLKTRIDDFLTSYMVSDEYTELKQRWLSGGSANASMPEYANEGNEVLKVGVSADVEPFVYVDSEGELAGFDIELALRLGQVLGMHVEFVEGDYAGLFPASESGRVDVVISAVPITEEREERYVFSEPYLEESAIFLARDKSVAAATDDGTDTSFFAQVGESVYSNLIKDNRYLLILEGLGVTVIIAIGAQLLSTVLGALLCWQRRSRRKSVSYPARAYIKVVESLPVLVLLMILYYVVFGKFGVSGVLIAIIAFGLSSAGYNAQIFHTMLETIDPGEIEAAKALGFNKSQIFFKVMLPQTLKKAMPLYRSTFVGMLKNTSIVGYIAIFDLTKAGDIIRSQTLDAFFPLVLIAVIYFLLAWGLTAGLRLLERHVDPAHRKCSIKGVVDNG